MLTQLYIVKKMTYRFNSIEYRPPYLMNGRKFVGELNTLHTSLVNTRDAYTIICIQYEDMELTV